MQFRPKLAKYFASPSVKKASSQRSKKKSYFSCPKTWSIAARCCDSWPGYPVMKFSMLSHPPNPAPRKMTLFPFSSTTFVSLTFRIPVDMVTVIIEYKLCSKKL